MMHISSQTRRKIYEALGFDFVLISFQTRAAFHDPDVRRTIYTVRRPKGKRFYHLIGYENGVIVRAY